MANTRTTMGEQACLDAIIGGTITDFEDDEIGCLRISAFNGCRQLRSVSLPRCTMLKGDAFRNCSALETAYLPRVEDLAGSAFAGCTSLRFIALPSLRTTGSQDQFYGCTGLVAVTFGPGFAADSPWGISFQMFTGCTSLVSLTLQTPGVVPLSASDASSAFRGTPIASGEGTIYVPAAHVEDYRADPRWSQYPIAAIAG